MTEPVSRRAVLAGACGTCAATLAGCATYDSAGPAGQAAPVPVAPSAAGAAPTTPADRGGGAAAGLADTADIPVGGGKVLVEQEMVITQPTEGEFKAFSAICTHQGCAVSEVTDGQITCTCHGSTFAVADGSPTGGPAKKALAEKKISVAGTSISLA